MATQSKLWPEGNESKNKTYIGRVSRAAGGKTVTREWEGLVDRQGDGGGAARERSGERERVRRTDATRRMDGRADEEGARRVYSGRENAREREGENETTGEERMAD